MRALKLRPSFKESLSVKKLYDDLDFWIMIGIGDDIILARDQRQEYALLVKRAEKYVESEMVPKYVKTALHIELKKPWYKQPTFYWLLWLAIKRKFKKN